MSEVPTEVPAAPPAPIDFADDDEPLTLRLPPTGFGVWPESEGLG